MPREREPKFNPTSATYGGGHKSLITMTPNFDCIKQHGKIVLFSNDNVSIQMIFRNLIGQNIKEVQYVQYLQNVAFADMGFSYREHLAFIPYEQFVASLRVAAAVLF